ncbi:transcriptional regulator [Virgibacillus phasianinus]|uniref:Transcriptional regulator n=1 Tax=Virgibacillus phasianinus TaxID=2017483 RepID=A0A220U8K3_9BACI|nr:PLDc N-terminal domain-containing protein [Virgibacillus phasianinus]ASK64191.1 transcriptional regulator [Virgibacillus phasianinus]
MNVSLNEIPWGAIAPILVLQLILMITALVSCIREEKTNGPKWLWILLILFIGLIGPVLYFVVGRRNN